MLHNTRFIVQCPPDGSLGGKCKSYSTSADPALIRSTFKRDLSIVSFEEFDGFQQVTIETDSHTFHEMCSNIQLFCTVAASKSKPSITVPTVDLPTIVEPVAVDAVVDVEFKEKVNDVATDPPPINVGPDAKGDDEDFYCPTGVSY
jgi:hypothetical protein